MQLDNHRVQCGYQLVQQGEGGEEETNCKTCDHSFCYTMR